MRSADHLRILGPDTLAEIRRRAAAAPPAPPEVIEALRPILAPAMARVLAREADEQQAAQTAA